MHIHVQVQNQLPYKYLHRFFTLHLSLCSPLTPLDLMLWHATVCLFLVPQCFCSLSSYLYTVFMFFSVYPCDLRSPGGYAVSWRPRTVANFRRGPNIHVEVNCHMLIVMVIMSALYYKMVIGHYIQYKRNDRLKLGASQRFLVDWSSEVYPQ